VIEFVFPFDKKIQLLLFGTRAIHVLNVIHYCVGVDC